MKNRQHLICEDVSDDLLYLSLKISSKIKQSEDLDINFSFEEEIQFLKEVSKKLDELHKL